MFELGPNMDFMENSLDWIREGSRNLIRGDITMTAFSSPGTTLRAILMATLIPPGRRVPWHTLEYPPRIPWR